MDVREHQVTVVIDVEATSVEDARREVARIFDLAKGPAISWVRYDFADEAD